MKRLYALVIALLMLCAGCNVKTTPEPQTIPPIETPMQQGGSATTAPDENVPIPPAEPSAPAEGDISPKYRTICGKRLKADMRKQRR